MSNMSYCRFQNTVKDLRDCEENIHEFLAETKEWDGGERKARRDLIEICVRIAEEYGAKDEDGLLTGEAQDESEYEYDPEAENVD